MIEFKDVMEKIREANEIHPEISFQLRPSTRNHFQITAIRTNGTHVTQYSIMESYKNLNAAELPMLMLQETFKFMADNLLQHDKEKEHSWVRTPLDPRDGICENCGVKFSEAHANGTPHSCKGSRQ